MCGGVGGGCPFTEVITSLYINITLAIEAALCM